MITLATTTVTVSAPSTVGDDWTAPTYGVIASNVRATLSAPQGAHTRTVGADSVQVDMILDCDPVPGITPGCIILDAEDGQTYAIEWIQQRTNALGLGNDHAGVTRRTGEAD